jgi:hypothetical protein
MFFLENRLTDGNEVVSLTRLLLLTPRKIHGTEFCWRLSRPQSHSAVVRIGLVKKKSSDLLLNRTRHVAASNTANKPTTLPPVPETHNEKHIQILSLF